MFWRCFTHTEYRFQMVRVECLFGSCWSVAIYTSESSMEETATISTSLAPTPASVIPDVFKYNTTVESWLIVLRYWLITELPSDIMYLHTSALSLTWFSSLPDTILEIVLKKQFPSIEIFSVCHGTNFLRRDPVSAGCCSNFSQKLIPNCWHSAISANCGKIFAQI